MANQEALIAEYSALRQEILQQMQMNIQFKAASLAVASAFVVYGFQAQNSIAFLSATVILVAALYYSANSTRALITVGTYIYAIIEPKIEGLQWETMTAERRKRKNNIFSLSFLSISYPTTICIQALLEIGCIFFTWWFLRDYRIFNVLLYSCITFVLGVSFIIVSVYAIDISSKKFHSDRVGQWKKIEEELYPTVAAIHIKS